ncbi:MAG: retention module-containing protein [Pseudomonas sp.]|uniref:retention module-containing protein n=1 Tax=Pseudomonas sp. TaxID=306 RepID=UPI0039828AEB
MATLIGVVSQVIGEVYAVAGDGARRPLSEGDRVFAGEQIVTGAAGAIAVALSNGQQLTLGRESSLNLTEQMLADSSSQQLPNIETAPAVPTDGDLTDVEKLQAAIEAGVDPTLEGEATAAGPGAGAGGTGSAGGGSSFVLLTATGGALDPTIGFPTEGLSNGPEFPNPDPVAAADAPDFSPTIEIEYEDATGSIVVGPAIVDEEALFNGSNPSSNAEQASGQIVISSPDGTSSLQVQGFDGVWVDVTAGGVVVGQYGTLTVDAAGNWTYTLTSNTFNHSDPNATGAADQVGENFPVRMFDLDGDVSPTVFIDVLVNDDGPLAQLNQQSEGLGVVGVDESLLSLNGAYTDGVDTAVLESEVVQAQFNSVFGADGAAAGNGGTVYSLTLNGADVASGLYAVDANAPLGQGEPIVLNQLDNVITGSAGGVDYFTLSINPVSGAVTLELLDNLWHSNSNDADDSEVLSLTEGALLLTQTVTDGDGDSDSVSIDLGAAGAFSFEDDGPLAQLNQQSEGLGVVGVDESLLSLNGAYTDGIDTAVLESEVVQAQFNSVFGADGAAAGDAGTVYSLALNGADVPSGLYAVDPNAPQGQGEQIVLNQLDNVITGSAGGVDYFTLTIDPASGAVTLELLDNLWHSNTSNADDSEVLSLTEGALLLTQTVTDGDGDSDSVSIDLGAAGAFSFEDDGPEACIYINGPWALVVHDESAGLQNLLTSWWKPGDWDNDVSSASVFNAVSNKGSDIDPAGFAKSLTPIVGIYGSSYGADGMGSTVLSLELTGAQGSDSGLKTTDGTSINLYLEGDLIVGRVAGGAAVGQAAFAVAIGSDGSISIVQYMSLQHPVGGSSYDEAVTLVGKLNAVVTVTDGDGDVAVEKVSVGHVIGFEDDGPVANIQAVQGVNVVHDESHGLQNATATPAVPGDANDNDSNGVSSLFNSVVNRGGDLSPKGYAQSNGPLVSTSGSSYGQDQEGATSKLSLAVVGGNGSDSGLTTTAGFAIKLSVELGLVVGRIVGGPDAGKAAFAVAIGADGTVSVAQYVSLEHPVGGSSYDEAVSLAGKVQVVLTVTDGDGDVAVDKVNIGSAIRFEDDGPTACINLKGPWADVTHDETAGLQNFWHTWALGDISDNDVAYLSVFNGVANKATDINPTGFAKSATAVVTTLGSSYGEDEEGATAQLSLVVKNGNGDDSGLRTTDGHSITLHLEGALIVGRIVGGADAGKAAFAIAIGADGSLSLAQYVSLQHPIGGSSYDEAVNLAGKIQAVVTITDGDGDVAVDKVDIGSVIRFEDDGPTANISLVSNAGVTHDESAGLQNALETPLISGDANDNDVADLASIFSSVALPGTGLDPLGYAQSSGAVVSAAGSSVGQDEEGAMANLSLALQGANGLDSGLKTTDGSIIRLYVESGGPGEADLVVGRVSGGVNDGKAAFAVAIGSDGKLSVVQYLSLYHPDGSSADESISLNGKIQAVLTITDGDGDVSVDSVNIGHVIRFEDDAPTAGQVTAAVVLDDEGLAGGINGGTGDVAGAATSTSGNLLFEAGADGLKSIALSGPLTLGSESVTSTWNALSNTLTISSVRGDLLTVVLTDPASGAYTINLLQPLMHPVSGSEDDITLNIGYTVTDGDNDSATGSLVVTIDDDTPAIQAGSIGVSSFVTFQGSDAGFSNSYGYYNKAADGTPLDGKVIWANVHAQSVGDVADLSGLDPATTGFFIIPHGGGNAGLVNGSSVTFEFVAGHWQASLGGVPLTGADGASVLFSDASLNPGGSHLQDTGSAGNQNWEDQTLSSDYDYNDVSTNVTWGSALQVDESNFTFDATANFSSVFNVQPGADGQQSLTYQLSVQNADSGLVDSATNEAVILSVNAGVIQGRTAVSNDLVFTLSVDAAGTVKLDQGRAIVHPTGDPDEAKFLGAGHVSLGATVTDDDGDQANASIDIGTVISFKDDGPQAVDDNPAAVIEGSALASQVSGNVLVNDTAGNDLGKAFVGWNNGANSAALTELARYGSLVLEPSSGNYSFVLDNADPDVINLVDGQTISQSLLYTMRDADGDISTAELTITIVGSNSGPEINIDPGNQGTNDHVYEAGLNGVGSAAASDSEFASGTFQLSDPDGLADLESVTIDGQLILIGDLGNNNQVVGEHGTLTITAYDNTTGIAQYRYELTERTENLPGAEEDVFTLTVSDGSQTSAPATITIDIVDDAPIAKDNSICVPESGLPPFSVTLILDRSGSMGSQVLADIDGNGDLDSVSRLQVAKQALLNLIDSYVALGVPLNFNLIGFGDNASMLYEGHDAAAAKAAILNPGLDADGFTNYADALNLAKVDLEDELSLGGEYLPGYQHKVYFLSDGEPNPSSNDAPANWQAFVDANGIDVIAVGIQVPDGSAAADELKEVANANEDVVLVQNPDELSAALDATLPDPVSGNLITDIDALAGVDIAGADGAVVVTQISFVVSDASAYQDGNGHDADSVVDLGGGQFRVTYQVEGGTSGVIETPEGGWLNVSSDGTYSYSAPANVSGDTTEVFTYTIKDSDGSTSEADLNICIEDGAPVARNNTVSVAESSLQPYSLTLILDRSGSMDDDVIRADLDGDGYLENTTRLQVAKQALVNLIDSYAALGGLGLLNINFIAFGDGASLRYEGDDLIAAKNAILNGSLSADGSTNYAAALNMARGEIEDEMSAGGSEYLPGYQHKVYFLSDGEPNPSSADAPDDWQAFVDGNGIDVVAVGIQIASGSAAEGELKEVANAGETVVLVQNPAQLSATLGGTVPGTIDGNVVLDVDSVAGKDVLGNDLPVTLTHVSFSVDNGEVALLGQYQSGGATLTVGAMTTTVSFSVPNNGSDLTITTPLGGTLTIDKNGDYHYSAPGNVGSGVQEVITYTIADSDGSPSSADLIINITDSVPTAVNDSHTLAEGYWAGSGGNDTYTAQFQVDGTWSLGSIDHSLNDTRIDNASYNLPSSIDTEHFHLTADADHPGSVRFDADFRQFNSGDFWQTQVFKEGASSVVAQLTGQVGDLNNQEIGGITESGMYYVRFTVFDNTWGASNSSRADLRLSDIYYRSFSYTEPTTQTVSVAAPGLVWVAALLTGNVLANDFPGTDGGLQVTQVNGSAVALGSAVDIAGDYGTLHIASNGQYSYTQHPQDYQAGAADNFSYSIVDADGSTSSALLTVNLADHDYSSSSSNGNNFVGGEDANDTLNGQGGNDIVYGGAGNDTLNGGTGNDHLLGGSGDDILNGNDNNDILEGGLGNDQLNGGAGNDALLGGLGNDTLLGDAGDDILIGGLDSDTMSGGAGKDTFVWQAGDADGGVDKVMDFFVDTNGVNSDMLDLSELLSGLSVDPGGAELSQYLDFGFAGGTTTITVDKAGNGGAADQTIVLNGIDLSSSAYYGSSDAASVISGMLDDHALKVA